nr:efflux transporter outer membrane subunit [Novosphingobium sp. 9]
MAPAYHAPQTAAPAQFKEVAGWTSATPADGADRGAWWTVFNDPVLNDLEAKAAAASPTLAAALARYDAATASARIDASALYPQIGASGSAERARVSKYRVRSTGTSSTQNDYILGGSLDYELDLWGRVRNTVKAGRAEAAASGADLASARLSLQAQVADAYFRLRGLDAQQDLLVRSVHAYTKAYKLTEARHQGGDASGIDTNRSLTVLANAKALVSTTANQRAATEHELAALTGAVASTFSVPVQVETLAPPIMPVATPAVLLQRRPDISAAERRVFAANAEIGVAKAAYFPQISLGGSGGFDTTGPDFLGAPTSFWGLGPISAVLSIFDGGARKAKVRMSRAEYEEATATYRGTVLSAFQETEDAIAAMHHLADASASQHTAATAAQKTSDIAMIRYRDGASDYLDVVTAQTDALNAERTYIAVQTEQMQAAIAYVKAIGGSPDAAATPAGAPANGG